MAAAKSKTAPDLIRQRAAGMGADMLDVLEAMARAGDVQAAKAILNKSTPDLKPASAMVTFPLPKGQDLIAASWAILRAVSGSKLPPDIGASLIASLAQIARITEVSEFEKRLTVLEEQQP
jgi:hypothetical protein